MKKEISVRDYHPDDVQALANIYFNKQNLYLCVDIFSMSDFNDKNK